MAVGFALAWLLVTAVYVASPVVTNGDSYLVIPTAHSLLYERNVGLDEFMDIATIANHYGLREDGMGPAVLDADGHPMNYFPWITSVFAVPVVAAFDLASGAGLTHNSQWFIDNDRMNRLQVLSASIVTGLAAALLALVARELLRWTRLPSKAEAAARKSARVGGETANDVEANDATANGSNAIGVEASGASDDDRFRGVDPGRWWFLPGATLALGLATSLWSTASRAMWQHGPALLFLALATLAAVRLASGTGSRHRTLWALALGFGMVTSYWARPTTAALSVGLLVVLILTRRDALVAWGAGAACTMAVFLVANEVLTGRLVPAYYSGSRLSFHSHVVKAIAANLISPARGLLLFSPVLLLAGLLFLPSRWQLLEKNPRTFVGCSTAASALLLLGVSGFPHWWGGHSYGPRFTVEMVVALGPLALLAVLGPRRNATSLISRAFVYVIAPALLLVSTAIHFGGAWTDAGGCWNVFPTNVDSDPGRIWSWSDPEALLWARMILPPQDPKTDGGCDPHRRALR